MKKPTIYVVRAMPAINDVTYFTCWRQSACRVIADDIYWCQRRRYSTERDDERV